MNRIIKTAMIAVLFFVGVSFAQSSPVIWQLTGEPGNNQIERCAGYADCGYWFTYNDKNESGADGTGGCIGTDFPDTGEDAETDEVSEWWYGEGGTITYSYEEGCTYAYPFAGIGFNWQKPKAPSPNAKRGDGVRVYYKLEGSAGHLWMEFATCDPLICDDDHTLTNNGEFYVQLDVDDYLESGFEVLWEDFGQPAWATAKPGFDVAVTGFLGFKFKWTDLGGSVTAGVPKPPTGPKSIQFTLKKLEFINAAAGGTPIVNVGVKSQVQMSLAGKTLFFNGIASNAAVEVINLQGALVAKGNVGPKGNSIDLSRLGNGVYIVRLNGEKLNLTQKIAIK